METKHTPGPWIRAICLNGDRGVRSTGGYVCFLPKPSKYEGQDERYKSELAENEATQRLIAASPDLLANLQQCVVVLQVIDPENPAIKMAELAIKKATE